MYAVLLYCCCSFVECRQASCSLIAGETRFVFSSHHQILLIDREVEVWWLIFCLKHTPASLMLLGFPGPSLRAGRDGPSASKHSEPKLWPPASSSSICVSPRRLALLLQLGLPHGPAICSRLWPPLVLAARLSPDGPPRHGKDWRPYHQLIWCGPRHAALNWKWTRDFYWWPSNTFFLSFSSSHGHPKPAPVFICSHRHRFPG